MATGLLSKGITLGYKKSSSYEVIPDLQEIPDLGGDVDTVEVTTLADGAKRYIKGLTDYGSLEFTFLYDNSTATSSYRVVKGLEGAVKEWEVSFPDGTKFHFSGEVTTKVKSAGTGAALTFTASIACNSEIDVVNPSNAG